MHAEIAIFPSNKVHRNQLKNAHFVVGIKNSWLKNLTCMNNFCKLWIVYYFNHIRLLHHEHTWETSLMKKIKKLFYLFISFSCYREVKNSLYWLYQMLTLNSTKLNNKKEKYEKVALFHILCKNKANNKIRMRQNDRNGIKFWCKKKERKKIKKFLIFYYARDDDDNEFIQHCR